MSRFGWIALVVAAGCKYPDPGGLDGGPSITTNIVVHQTSSSTKVYLTETPSFGALESWPVVEEYNGRARVFTLFEFVFVATTDGTLRKLRHDGFGGLAEVATLDFAPLSITEFEDSWVVIDTKAYYFDQVGDRAFFVELDTMQVIETISLAAADVAGRTVTWTGAVQRDQDLYVGMYYEDPANPLVHETQMTVLRIDAGRRLQPLLHDTRCIRAQMVGVEQITDAVLIVGDSSYYQQFGMPSAAPENCLVRVETNPPNVIDTQLWPINQFTDNDVWGSYAFARTPERAYLWARETGSFATLAEYQATSRWRPHYLVLGNLESAIVSSDIVNIGGPGRAYTINDTPYFVVNKRDDNMPGGAIRADIGGGDWDEVGFFPPGEITLLGRVD
ncbi:MAG: hypothetical protein ACKV2T_03700 [Kofleriaceae bacterium]